MNHLESITLIVKLNFKTSMLRSSLCDYSDAYLLISGAITVTALAAGPPGGGGGRVRYKEYSKFY